MMVKQSPAYIGGTARLRTSGSAVSGREAVVRLATGLAHELDIAPALPPAKVLDT
jgi:hypothetical protein